MRQEVSLQRSFTISPITLVQRYLKAGFASRIPDSLGGLVHMLNISKINPLNAKIPSCKADNEYRNG
jgi:hypothetical protein